MAAMDGLQPGTSGGAGWTLWFALGYPKGDSAPDCHERSDPKSHRFRSRWPRAGWTSSSMPFSAARFSRHSARSGGAVDRSPSPVLSVDLPSGLNGTDGSVSGAVFRASRTVTFHALKTGHLVGVGPDVSGEWKSPTSDCQVKSPNGCCARTMTPGCRPVPERLQVVGRCGCRGRWVAGHRWAAVLAGRAGSSSALGWCLSWCREGLRRRPRRWIRSHHRQVGTGNRFTAKSVDQVIAAPLPFRRPGVGTRSR